MNGRKIPTVLGIFLVLVMLAGLFVITNGVNTFTTFLTRADETKRPANITISNITDSSFIVSWTTESTTIGAVFYGTTPELDDGVAVDSKDIGQNIGKYKAHLVQISNLDENSKYYFKIGESEGNFGNPQNSNQPFEVSTGPEIPDGGTLPTASGKVLDSSGQPVTEGIAVWQAPNSSKIASILNSEGSYQLQLGEARTTNLESFFSPSQGTPEKVVITTANGQTATVNCVVGTVVKYPNVKIGQSIDCTDPGTSEASGSGSFIATAEEEIEDDVNIFEKDVNLDKEQFGSFANLIDNSDSSSDDSEVINIQSGETVSTGLPTFSGKVQPKQVIKIEVHSDNPVNATVISKPDGSWSWTPPSTLAPGEHTVTLTIVNADGTTQTVTKTFFITAGEEILPITQGTPSGQVSPTPTAIPTNNDELLESGVETPTITALTIGSIFIILSIGAIFVLN